MEVIEAIKKRKSVRKFKKEEVPKKLLLKLVEAAKYAPSGKNLQPYKFKIITKPKEKQLLKQNPIFLQEFVNSAPAIILCCYMPDEYVKAGYGGSFEYNKNRCLTSLAIASQNIILRATELGLGTCYVGDMNTGMVNELFMPPACYVAYAICVGYSDDGSSQRQKKEVNELLL
ncbi:MAG: nitroreductase family protein [Candidatus Nanoarchaeia archaeon]